MAFESFYAATEGQPPSSLAVAAVKALGKPGGRALDIGSGAGRDAVYLAEQGFEVEAIDPNPLASAPDIANVTFSHEGAENFTRPVGTYRLVLCNKVLPFIATPGGLETALRKIGEVLAPDGVAAISFFGERDDWRNRPGVRTLTVDEARAAIAVAHLREVDLREQEMDQPAAGAELPKHWHILRFLTARAD